MNAVPAANLVGITGIARRLVLDGALDEVHGARGAGSGDARAQADLQLPARQPPGDLGADGGRQLDRVRHAGVRPGVDGRHAERHQAGQGRVAHQAQGAAAVQARQQAVRRHGRPDQLACAGRDQVPHQPDGRADPGRRGQDPPHRSNCGSNRTTRSATRSATAKAWTTSTSAAATTTSPTTAASTPRATTRRSSSSSTRC